MKTEFRTEQLFEIGLSENLRTEKITAFSISEEINHEKHAIQDLIFGGQEGAMGTELGHGHGHGRDQRYGFIGDVKENISGV